MQVLAVSTEKKVDQVPKAHVTVDIKYCSEDQTLS